LAVRRPVRERNASLICGFTCAFIAAPLAALVAGRPLVIHSHEILTRSQWMRRFFHAV